MATHIRDDLYDRLTRTAPDFLRYLAHGWSDPRTAFDAYLRTGDDGGLFAFSYREATGGIWEGLGYRGGTGRLLPVDMVEHLRQYFAERSAGPNRLCWLTETPDDDTPKPIGATQLQTLLSVLPPADGVEPLGAALQPLLQGIAQGTLTFGDKPHRVIVTTRRPTMREPG
jgi:hypothetical protein